MISSEAINKLPVEITKIEQALQNAFAQSGEKKNKIKKILQKSANYLSILFSNSQNTLSIDQLGNLLAKILEEEKFPETAKIIQKDFHLFLYDANSQADKLDLRTMEDFYHLPKQLGKETDFLNLFSDKFSKIKSKATVEKLIKNSSLLPGPHFFQSNNIDQQNIVLEDDLDDIFNTLRDTVSNQSLGIYTTLDFSKIRPAQSQISKRGKSASGPLSFIKIFLHSLNQLHGIQPSVDFQLKLNLSIDHPDILDYLMFLKQNERIYDNEKCIFQIQITKEFIESISGDQKLLLINPQNKKVINQLDSEATLELIADVIKQNPQVHLQFAAIQENTFQHYFVNLAEIESLESFTQCLEQISVLHTQTQSPKTKPLIYLMGLAESLINQQIPYQSVASLEFCENLAHQIKQHSDLLFSFETNLNAAQLFKVTAGMEPLPQLWQNKKNIDGKQLSQLHPILEKTLYQNHLSPTQVLEQLKIGRKITQIDFLPAHISSIFQDKTTIDTLWSFQLQKVFQAQNIISTGKKITFHQMPGNDVFTKLLIEQFGSMVSNIGYFEFPLNSDSDLDFNIHAPDFLFMHADRKKKTKTELQPALFPLKKTEEIHLPPINPQIHA